MYGIGIFVTSVLTILTPLAAKNGGATALIIVRVIEGIFEVILIVIRSAIVLMA